MGIGSALASAPSATTLRALIKIRFRRVQQIPSMDAGDWIRVSSLPNMCPREEVIASCLGKVRENVVEPDQLLTFSHGTAIHHQLQNEILPAIDVLRGQWKCAGCGTLYGGIGCDAIRRPDKCCTCPLIPVEPRDKNRVRAGQEFQDHEFVYVEQWFGDDYYRIGGHCDGLIQLPGFSSLGVLEVKSISSHQAPKVKDSPDIGHVIQLQSYLWLTGLKWGKILYWEKGAYGLASLIEHPQDGGVIERDEPTICLIKELAKSIRDGIRTGVLPGRICNSSECKRAESCELCKTCFDLDEHGTLNR